MSSTPLQPAEAYAAALRGARCRVLAPNSDSRASELHAWRWVGDADDADELLLSRCRGATVDIGCGPGRMTAALSAKGVAALGIDIVSEAVRQTRARGAAALTRDVFERLPGEGRWDSALLADGNVGIGGDPVRLLRRVSELIAPDGKVIVEVASPGGEVAVHRLRLEVDGRQSLPFRWAVVPADRLAEVARAAALRILELAVDDGRWFAQLARADRRA
jgi:SAM-dependent methyltransferase